MADEIPAVGTEQWETWSENLLRERDELKARLAEVEVDVDARNTILEADLTNLRRRADTLRSVCDNILTHPKMPREDVQSRLLIATQKYDGM